MIAHARATLALFACIVLAASSVRAQGTGSTTKPKFVAPDTLSTVRGTVTDPSGHPLDSIEVYVMTSGQSVRPDATGRYTIINLLNGPTRLRARRVGWRPVDTSFVLARHGIVEMNFVLSGRVTALDTIRVRTSQDDCAPRNFYAFACRRRAGVGVFRDSAEIAALKPDWDADLFDGIPGLRRDGHGVVAVTHWRCISRLINGHPPTLFDRESAKMLGWIKDVKAIEFYADSHDVPKWYQVYAWPRGSPYPCSLIVYWTK